MKQRKIQNDDSNNITNKKSDHSPFRQIPSDVLSRARSTLFSIGGALKPRPNQDGAIYAVPCKGKNSQNTLSYFTKSKPKSKSQLKTSKSEPEIKTSEETPRVLAKSKLHSSMKKDSAHCDFDGRLKPRPLSVGATQSVDSFDDISRAESYSGYSHCEFPDLESRELFGAQSYLPSKLILPVQADNSNMTEFERPQKKLSFMEPEIMTMDRSRNGYFNKVTKNTRMGVNSLNKVHKNKFYIATTDSISGSLDDLDSELESQAMRIVRTVGQAFEVCHKLSINSSPSPEPQPASASGFSVLDDLTELGLSDQASNIDDNMKEKETAGNGAGSIAAASTSSLFGAAANWRMHFDNDIRPRPSNDSTKNEMPVRPQYLELLPPPPSKHEGRRSPRRSAAPPGSSGSSVASTSGMGIKVDMNLNAIADSVIPNLKSTAQDDKGSATGSSSVTPLSAQHELQLLREQLDQQEQQTRAAVAQLLLLADQLTAEKSARCEAQARTHQLLMHNKELLDHISALVSHLQEREKGISGSSNPPISVQQLTMVPQTCAQQFPSRQNGNNQRSSIQNVPSPQQFENASTYNDICALFPNFVMNNNSNAENNNITYNPFKISSPVVPSTPLPTSATGSVFNFPNPQEQFHSQLINKMNSLGHLQTSSQPSNTNNYHQEISNYFHEPQHQLNHTNQNFRNGSANQNNNFFVNLAHASSSQNINNISPINSPSSLNHNSLGPSPLNFTPSSLTSSPTTPTNGSSPDSSQFSSDGSVQFIRPLSQMGTLTTFDDEGRLRVIVPISPDSSVSNITEYSNKKPKEYPKFYDNVHAETLSGVTLKVTDECGNTVKKTSQTIPSAITRTTSEKVPNRSEMMNNLRSQWTRHTTK